MLRMSVGHGEEHFIPALGLLHDHRGHHRHDVPRKREAPVLQPRIFEGERDVVTA